MARKTLLAPPGQSGSSRNYCVAIAVVAGMLLALAAPARAQQDGHWTGAIRCEIQALAQGYTHQEVQTWTLTGGAPTVQGSVSAYPATWSVVGQGRHDRSSSTSRRVAQWTVSIPGSGSPVSAPVGFTLQPAGRGLDVTKWHAQLTAGGGYTGTDQYINAGVPQAAQRLAATVYEWQFPKIEAAATDTQLSGSRTTEVKAFVGPLQPTDARATVTCTWSLGRGSSPPLSPPVLVTSTPGAPASGGPASGGAAPGAGTSGSTAGTPPGGAAPGATTPGTVPGSPAGGTGTAAAPQPPSSSPSTSAPVSAGAIQVSSTDLQFGEVPMGSAGSLVVTLTNTGGGSYGPINLAAGAPLTGGFAASQNCLARTLPVGQSCAVTYTFTPAQAGPANAISNLAIGETPIQSDAVPFRISLSGTGVAARPSSPSSPPSASASVGVIRLSSTDLQFGQIEVGTTNSQVLTITNAGSDPYRPQLAGGGSSSPVFESVQDCAGRTLRAGQSCAMTYTFKPTQVGTVRDVVDFWVDNTTVHISLSGTGVATQVSAPAAPVNALPGLTPGGGLTAQPTTTAAAAPATPVDPADFTATQTGDGTLRLTWSAVPGAGSYVLGGPGTNTGITVNGTSHTLTGIAPGTHTWTVATMYNPGGILTTADRWSRATMAVVNKSGRYRILISGLRVNHEAAAGNFGEHNAVYAAAAVKVLGRQNGSAALAVLQGPAVVRTRAHGDVRRDPTRIRAGSASSSGGLLAGDVLPAGQDPAATTLAPSTTTFPLLLWEGTLTDGVEVVVIRPTLWVHNLGPHTYEYWRGLVTAAGEGLVSVIETKIGAADLSPYRVPYPDGSREGSMFHCLAWDKLGWTTECRSNMDRPIGLLRNPYDNLSVEWTDLLVVLTREAIEKALSSPYQTGGANGVIAIHLRDGYEAWNGNYDLYLRVDRVP